jgi:uncharacterized Fe-S cluster protein YjdI
MADDPLVAGLPGTKGPTRAYEGIGIRVIWDATRCIHTGNCLRAEPGVFNVGRRPWVDVDGASAEAIARAVETCPTGALRYESTGPLPDEQPQVPTVVEVRPNGPLFVRGAVRMVDAAGQVITEETRLALCRCGASRNRPFCDNTHREIGFRG